MAGYHGDVKALSGREIGGQVAVLRDTLVAVVAGIGLCAVGACVGGTILGLTGAGVGLFSSCVLLRRLPTPLIGVALLALWLGILGAVIKGIIWMLHSPSL